MFKIYDDKVYFVAETPDINKVIEIFLPKDNRGTIMDSHEIRMDLCRAIRKLQHDGYTIMKVYPAMGDRRESIDVLSMPEFIQSAKCPDNDVEEAVVFSYFESGATFQLPCKVNKETHEIIPYESKSILSGLKYNRNDKVTDFHLAYLLNEGRAKNLDSNIYKKREPHVDKLEYEFNKTGNIDFYSGELYLNAIGDVVSGCDWSYKSQKKYRFGNVMNKNWLENISNSELYIAS